MERTGEHDKVEGEYLYLFVATFFFIVQVGNWRSGSRGSVFEVSRVCVCDAGGWPNGVEI